MTTQQSSIDAHTALIYVMVLTAAADRDLTDAELLAIGRIVRFLPGFEGFNVDLLPRVAASCADILQAEDGVDVILELVKRALPERLRETAYAVACDVAATGGAESQEVLRLLEIIRHKLGIGRLVAAAIERAARAHFQRL